MAVNVGQSPFNPVVFECETDVIKSQQMQDRCIQVVHVNTGVVAIDDVVAEVVGLSVAKSALDPGAGKVN